MRYLETASLNNSVDWERVRVVSHSSVRWLHHLSSPLERLHAKNARMSAAESACFKICTRTPESRSENGCMFIAVGNGKMTWNEWGVRLSVCATFGFFESIKKTVTLHGTIFRYLPHLPHLPHSQHSQHLANMIEICVSEEPVTATTELYSRPFPHHPMMIASIIDRCDITRVILQQPLRFPCPDEESGEALFEAVSQGFVEVVRVFIDFRMSLEMHGGNNVTPLHAAVACGDVDMVMLLLGANANVEGAPLLTDPPLYTAAGGPRPSFGCRDHFLEIAVMLLDAGARVDPPVAVAMDRCTPLANAARLKNYPMMTLLLDRGASPDLANVSMCRNDRKFLRTYIKSWNIAKAGKAALIERLRIESLNAAKVQSRTLKKVRQKQMRDVNKVPGNSFGTVCSTVTACVESFDETLSEDYDVCCVVCMDKPRGILLLPCGHLIMCESCLVDMTTHCDRENKGPAHCPYCREPITSHKTITD